MEGDEPFVEVLSVDDKLLDQIFVSGNLHDGANKPTVAEGTLLDVTLVVNQESGVLDDFFGTVPFDLFYVAGEVGHLVRVEEKTFLVWRKVFIHVFLPGSLD